MAKRMNWDACAVTIERVITYREILEILKGLTSAEQIEIVLETLCNADSETVDAVRNWVTVE
jgi:hypothetical protein